MLNLIGVVLCRDGDDPDAVRDAWTQTCLPEVRRLPGLRYCAWNRAADRFARDTDPKHPALPVAGFVQCILDPGPGVAELGASPAGQGLRAAEAKVTAMTMVLEVEQRVVISPPRDLPRAVKTMSIIRRADGYSHEAFLYEWRVVHVPLVQAVKPIRGYRQHLVTGRWRNWSEAVDDTAFPFDGAVELWYESPDVLSALRDSAAGQATAAHAAKTSARVEKYQIGSVTEWFAGSSRS
ncbi:EthD domain-containing protein [uncultured Alsobacter sp.]|uniref:EthD domain-containing protein n=1 Tax=uncultured Alsobacter sp. TaxID=1748258 RepID=UPI0025E76A95|nr:EthD domain-containing protein [uncultured Alsobacter sp.]